jgi:hypothetical protein
MLQRFRASGRAPARSLQDRRAEFESLEVHHFGRIMLKVRQPVFHTGNESSSLSATTNLLL